MESIMICDGGHKVHLVWARSVGCKYMMYYDLTKLRLLSSIENRGFRIPAVLWRHAIRRITRLYLKNLERKFNVIICEGGTPLPEASIIKEKSNGKLILLAANGFFYKLRMGDVKLRAYRRYLSMIDGIIAVSKMVANDANNVIKVPTLIVHPFADIERYLSIRPNLKSKNIIFLGRITRDKGVDVLVDAFKIVKRELSESKLFIIGEGPLRRQIMKQRINGVYLPGYIKDPRRFLSLGSIYVQPSRYDAFPIAVLEAMSAGLIPIVSEHTGTKEILPRDLVVKNDPYDLAHKMLEVLSMPMQFKLELSRKMRKIASRFTLKHSIEQFKRSFHKILNMRVAKQRVF